MAISCKEGKRNHVKVLKWKSNQHQCLFIFIRWTKSLRIVCKRNNYLTCSDDLIIRFLMDIHETLCSWWIMCRHQCALNAHQYCKLLALFFIDSAIDELTRQDKWGEVDGRKLRSISANLTSVDHHYNHVMRESCSIIVRI